MSLPTSSIEFPRLNAMQLKVLRLDKSVELPSYAHEGDAGLDLRCADDLVVVEPQCRTLIATGIAIELPLGYAGFVQPRSGLAIKHGLTLLNTPGLIDCHYRGEIKVIAFNSGDTPITFKKNDRIAQLVIQKVETAEVVEVSELSDSIRGSGGFGSTGV